MSEVEGPVVNPNFTFLKGRPPLTLEAKRWIKDPKKDMKFSNH